MAHIQQLQFINSVKNLYPNNFENCSVLEIGSLDINGTVRTFFHNCKYLGLDVGEGKGVDLVCEGQNFKGPDNFFDTVISCECFEHNPYWVETFLNMHRVCKSSGLIIMSCATTGRKEHGTYFSEPLSSPLTIKKGWNYYKNLEKKDFVSNFNLDELFINYSFSTNTESFDLYFSGIKK